MKTKTMTDGEINVAVYEGIGATWWISEGGFHYLGFKPANPMFRPCDRPQVFDSVALRDVPRYASDLNAMHEAEKIFTEAQRCAYCGHLRPIGGHTWTAAHTTARQRAEAFLRTIGKWVEPAEVEDAL